MAKTNLLNTRTVNFVELLGNGKIYRVPPYQRDYSWQEEEWEDLWNDIVELRGRPEELHYMGALVVEGKSDREFHIIDGQQRLATLSILSLAVIARLRELANSGNDAEGNKERASALRNRVIGEKDPASLIESSKLFLNEVDDAFYQDYLVQLRTPLNPRGLPKSNRVLWNCFVYFKSRLEKETALVSDGRALAEVISETVARQLMFILITVDNEINAYTVFETLNARGLELSATDLLKNFLFSRVNVPNDRMDLQRRWRALMTTVGQERFPSFLRYHLLCEQPKIRSQRLFKLVRDKIKTLQDVWDLVAALEGRAELFSALFDSNHAYWLERRECLPYIRELNLFRVYQPTALLFAAWERFSPENFASVLRLVSIFSFRYTIVSGLNPNELEPLYHFAAKAILDGSATTPAQVFQRLKSLYVSDQKFEEDFGRLIVETSGQRKKLAKYILAKLECDVSGRACDPETDPGTIEHILPENPLDVWAASFPREQWEASVYRLGNLTLLEASANREVGNADYTLKKVKYGTSIYSLTKAIPNSAPDEWTLALLEKRQHDLAGRAAHIWRVDFN